MDAPPVQYVKTSDGYDIAYCVSGEGQPLVLSWPPLFGSVEQVWKWPISRPFFEALGSQFKLIQYDLRGTGNSTRGLPSNHSQSQCDLDLETVIDRVGLNDDLLLCSLVYTAHTAIDYAVRHPERVAGLILISPAPADDAWAAMRNWESLYTNSWQLFLTAFAQTFFPGEPEDTLAYIQEAATQADTLIHAAAFGSSNVEPILPSITAPVLILASRQAAWRPMLDASRTYASLMPDTRLVVLDEGRLKSVFSTDSRPPPVIPVIQDFVDGLSANPREAEQLAVQTLSQREVEVLRLVAAGKSNQQIADELVISLNTVRRHVSNVFDKTGVANRAQAAVYAKEHGIV